MTLDLSMFEGWRFAALGWGLILIAALIKLGLGFRLVGRLVAVVGIVVLIPAIMQTGQQILGGSVDEASSGGECS